MLVDWLVRVGCVTAAAVICQVLYELIVDTQQYMKHQDTEVHSMLLLRRVHSCVYTAGIQRAAGQQ